MLDLIGQMFGASQQGGEQSITFSIPKDHPHADKLLKLSQVLSGQRQLPGGIIIQEGITRPDASDQFLNALREALGNEIFDELMAEFDRRRQANEDKTLLQAGRSVVGDPITRSTFLHAFGAMGALGQMPADARQSALNTVDDLARKTR